LQLLVTKPTKAAIPGTLTANREVAWLGSRTAITVLPSVASLKAFLQFANPCTSFSAARRTTRARVRAGSRRVALGRQRLTTGPCAR
jgi:hypothetical protein